MNFYYCSAEGIWRALGLGKLDDGEKLRGDVSCPCWDAQLWDAEPLPTVLIDDYLLSVHECGAW